MSTDTEQPKTLKRQLGTPGAVMLGLGSIVGTGAFVSIGIGAGIAGPAVVIAIGLAALVATCNGLSSAQLAASHPVSGGTYEYGYHYASPLLGFIAGWMFLCAKGASAATAALGLTGYLLHAVGVDPGLRIPVALVVVLVLTLVIRSGMQRTNRINIAIVSITLGTLLFFVIAGLPSARANGPLHVDRFLLEGIELDVLLQATALMFVAYTGYGRIATLGEEVRDPRRTIPRAVIATLLISMFLYMAVGAVGVGAVGAKAFHQATAEHAATLEVVAGQFDVAGASWVLALGALTAMAGVLLNLILGLSRVALAMGRRSDMPSALARVNDAGTTPTVAVIAVGALIGGLVLLGSVETTWSFSAFTVLIYYAITNYCALRMPSEQRLYPRWIAWLGLLSCLSLAFFVEQTIWLTGLALLGCGALWHSVAQRLR